MACYFEREGTMHPDMSLVLDLGSSSTHVGFSGDDAPRLSIPSVLGYPKYPISMVGIYSRQCYVGDEAQTLRGVLDLQYPINRAEVRDWEQTELLLRHIYESELRGVSSERKVLLTEPPLSSRHNREGLATMMFESFGVPGLFIANQAVLTLYASGRGVGVVVDCGEGVTHVVPIYQGYSIPNAVQRLDLAGRDVTDYLGHLLMDKGHCFSSTAEMEIVRTMKEKVCYVAEDFRQEVFQSTLSSSISKQYELPDGSILDIDTERFVAPEILFDPYVIDPGSEGLHELLYSCIKRCDIDLRRDFYTNVILSGGSTLMLGLCKRLEQEFQRLIPPRMLARVVAPPERKYSVWIGGSIVASLSTFQSSWVTKQEYEEYGPGVMHQRAVL